MLDLFSIFSKGGIVLWCFQSTSDIFSPSVNALIRSVILQVSSLLFLRRLALLIRLVVRNMQTIAFLRRSNVAQITF